MAEFASKGVAGTVGLVNQLSGCNGGVLGGTTFVILRRMDDIVSQYLPMLKTSGIVNDNNQIDIEIAKGFINSAFEKSGRVTVFNFTFDKTDGEALIGILEKYQD